MFELEQLRQLIVVAEEGTISAAAVRLHLSQPALSRSMQRLEQELGFPLFVRQKNRVSLNRCGLLLLDYGRDLLRDAERITALVREEDRKNHVFQVGGCAPYPLSQICLQLSAAYPDQIIESRIADIPSLERDLREGALHLAVLPFPAQDAGTGAFFCCQEHLSVCFPTEHPLADRKDGLYLKDLDGLTMLLHKDTGFWEDLCRREMPSAHFLVQAEGQVLMEIAHSSSIPFFLTDLFTRDNLQSETWIPSRAILPILDPEANPRFWCHYLPDNKKQFEKIL